MSGDSTVATATSSITTLLDQKAGIVAPTMRLAVLVLVGVALLAAPAQAQQAPVVTLVGSLQSELGCPGELQPECAATRLQQVSPGVFQGTFAVPAGSFEYKVALNNSWDENYGAGGVRGGSRSPTRPGRR